MGSKYKLINYALLAIVVSFIVIFYFFAKGINLVSNSSNAISLTSGFGFSFNDRYIFLPGEKRLRIESPGFYDQELTLNISDSSDLVTVRLLQI